MKLHSNAKAWPMPEWSTIRRLLLLLLLALVLGLCLLGYWQTSFVFELANRFVLC